MTKDEYVVRFEIDTPDGVVEYWYGGVAREVLDPDIDDVTGLTRVQAKAIRFDDVYGTRDALEDVVESRHTMRAMHIEPA